MQTIITKTYKQFKKVAFEPITALLIISAWDAIWTDFKLREAWDIFKTAIGRGNQYPYGNRSTRFDIRPTEIPPQKMQQMDQKIQQFDNQIHTTWDQFRQVVETASADPDVGNFIREQIVQNLNKFAAQIQSQVKK